MPDADRTPIGPLTADESARVLRSLVRRHPELGPGVRTLIDKALEKMRMQQIAREVALAVENVGYDELADSVAPEDEAPWQVLGDAVDPFVDDLKRRIALGREQDALALCEGIVLGLYCVRRSETAEMLKLARDFPQDAAREAFDIWNRGTRKLPAGFLRRVPEWRQLFRRSVTRG